MAMPWRVPPKSDRKKRTQVPMLVPKFKAFGVSAEDPGNQDPFQAPEQDHRFRFLSRVKYEIMREKYPPNVVYTKEKVLRNRIPPANRVASFEKGAIDIRRKSLGQRVIIGEESIVSPGGTNRKRQVEVMGSAVLKRLGIEDEGEVFLNAKGDGDYVIKEISGKDDACDILASGDLQAAAQAYNEYSHYPTKYERAGDISPGITDILHQTDEPNLAHKSSVTNFPFGNTRFMNLRRYNAHQDNVRQVLNDVKSDPKGSLSRLEIPQLTKRLTMGGTGTVKEYLPLGAPKGTAKVKALEKNNNLFRFGETRMYGGRKQMGLKEMMERNLDEVVEDYTAGIDSRTGKILDDGSGRNGLLAHGGFMMDGSLRSEMRKMGSNSAGSTVTNIANNQNNNSTLHTQTSFATNLGSIDETESLSNMDTASLLSVDGVTSLTTSKFDTNITTADFKTRVFELREPHSVLRIFFKNENPQHVTYKVVGPIPVKANSACVGEEGVFDVDDYKRVIRYLEDKKKREAQKLNRQKKSGMLTKQKSVTQHDLGEDDDNNNLEGIHSNESPSSSPPTSPKVNPNVGVAPPLPVYTTFPSRESEDRVMSGEMIEFRLKLSNPEQFVLPAKRKDHHLRGRGQSPMKHHTSTHLGEVLEENVDIVRDENGNVIYEGEGAPVHAPIGWLHKFIVLPDDAVKRDNEKAAGIELRRSRAAGQAARDVLKSREKLATRESENEAKLAKGADEELARELEQKEAIRVMWRGVKKLASKRSIVTGSEDGGGGEGGEGEGSSPGDGNASSAGDADTDKAGESPDDGTAYPGDAIRAATKKNTEANGNDGDNDDRNNEIDMTTTSAAHVTDISLGTGEDGEDANNNRVSSSSSTSKRTIQGKNNQAKKSVSISPEASPRSPRNNANNRSPSGSPNKKSTKRSPSKRQMKFDKSPVKLTLSAPKTVEDDLAGNSAYQNWLNSTDAQNEELERISDFQPDYNIKGVSCEKAGPVFAGLRGLEFFVWHESFPGLLFADDDMIEEDNADVEDWGVLFNPNSTAGGNSSGAGVSGGFGSNSSGGNTNTSSALAAAGQNIISPSKARSSNRPLSPNSRSKYSLEENAQNPSCFTTGYTSPIFTQGRDPRPICGNRPDLGKFEDTNLFGVSPSSNSMLNTNSLHLNSNSLHQHSVSSNFSMSSPSKAVGHFQSTSESLQRKQDKIRELGRTQARVEEILACEAREAAVRKAQRRVEEAALRRKERQRLAHAGPEVQKSFSRITRKR